MKKAFYITGILTVIMIILFLTGTLDFNNVIGHSLKSGNKYYASKDYDRALSEYGMGLAKKPEDTKLNFNAGQAAYSMNDYAKSAEYYCKAFDKADAFINAGNSYFKQGDGAGDINQKVSYCQKALEIYKQGIIKYPENVALKFNYEFVKSKIHKSDNSDENQDNEDKNNQKEEQNQDNSQKNQDQDSSGNQQGDSQNQDDQNGKQEQQDHEQEQQNQQQNQDRQSFQSGEDADEDNSSNEENSSSLNEADQSQDNKAIEQILEMLENQEQDSLKNNQEAKNSGKEDKYDW